MKTSEGLNKEMLAKSVQSLEEIKQGEVFDALITQVNYTNSSPISVAVSPFVNGNIRFDRIATAEDLQKETNYL
jgi:ribosomal protein S1